jgi:hypothetical protein
MPSGFARVPGCAAWTARTRASFGPVVVLRLLLILAILSAASSVRAACPLLERPGARTLRADDVRAKPVSFAFPPGERLEYSVRYFGVEVGRASVEVSELLEWQGRRVAHVVATARTNDIFSVLYRVDDRSEAWIDADKLVTLRTATHTRHGRRREVYEEVEFEWGTHFLQVFEARRRSADAHRLAFDFGPFVHDTFDVVYFLRSVPLERGKPIELPVYASKEVYGFRIEPGALVTIRSPVLGEVETRIVRPRNTLDGQLQDDGRGQVWVTNDSRRIPVRLRGWFKSTQGIRFGGLHAELVDYQPGDPDWPTPARGRSPSRVPVPSTVEGRPIWSPPPELAALREKQGIKAQDRRHAFTWPKGVGCAAIGSRRAGRSQSSKSLTSFP